MKILFIGGTGNISATLSRLVVERGHELHLLNRGKSRKHPLPAGARAINHDVHSGAFPTELRGVRYDVVVDWIAFLPSDVERDLAWFAGGDGGSHGHRGSTSSSARPRRTRSRPRTR